ncbi:family 43 glycosylhydrolase [Flavobacterium sp. LHD-85]|uniref:family 43 glycosylhydrolase n=1 Tax=Flavobacterium sp. LHD-85 TaxID=3071410 RepID=UPI0027E1E5CF|nr:family 43 glycosylhydrolase [Flavobacterium sp. LHD-85]MDQ6529166.1 family 43 glycosylhydrolase [Flavobacterium sp. LHD-85]
MRRAGVILLSIFFMYCGSHKKSTNATSPLKNDIQVNSSGKTEWFDPNVSQTTYCNPMNISYAYGVENHNGIPESRRSSADPVIMTYKGDYYLFATNQAGFFWSKDMSNWDFVYGSFQRQPHSSDICCPSALEIKDTLFLIGPDRYMPIWKTAKPKEGLWTRHVDSIIHPAGDPGVFLDDDGRLYSYYGTSGRYPLVGCELDYKTWQPIKGKDYIPQAVADYTNQEDAVDLNKRGIKELLWIRPKEHGWERFGPNNDLEPAPWGDFIEGAWMNKYNGKYYLQYAAPGTEFKGYANGVYVGDKPLGPFTYQPHNPMSYKPGGFVIGAGHGNTFEDLHGNFWNTGTCKISMKDRFERRIDMFPAGFDKDGIMYSITSYGDYPIKLSQEKRDQTKGASSGWMLLSYKKTAKVSSVDSCALTQTHRIDNQGKKVFENLCFGAENLTDENIQSWWSAKTSDPGEWLELDLGRQMEINALQINYADHKTTQFNKAMDIYHQYKIFMSDDAVNWQLVVDKSKNDRDVPHDYVELTKAIKARYIKMINVHMASGLFAVSDFRVFGNGLGAKPKSVSSFKVDRSKADSRNAMISWKKQSDAIGYNIYYGIAPDKLYNSIMVYGDNTYDFRGLDKGTKYYFTIEPFSENGIGTKNKIIEVK